MRQPSSSAISDSELSGLLDAAKEFLASMVIGSLPERRRWSQRTIVRNGSILRTIIEWMAVEGIRHFRDFDAPTLRRLKVWLASRTGRGGSRISMETARGYLWVLRVFYQQREKVRDAPLREPNQGAAQRRAVGVASRASIPAMPDEIAVSLLSAALSWVDEHSSSILRALELRRKALRRVKKSAGSKARERALLALSEVLTAEGLVGPGGVALDKSSTVVRVSRFLRDACFILIGGFVGMRVSEILSLEVGAIERRRGEGGEEQAYLVGRLYKTSDERDGRVERWIVPGPVVRAVEVMEALSLPLRTSSGSRSLFLMSYQQPQLSEVVRSLYVVRRMNEFATWVGVPLHEGKRWHLTTHQLRKTFARFVAKRDRTQLMALSEHFKHVSIAMTARGYVGTDFDLRELVDEEGRTETAAALERLLTSERLAGRTGERINTRGALFRGRAGDQVRKDYISFVLQETDLRIHACDYGWCVFQAETARCGGVIAPNEVERSPDTCLSCSNMVVEAQHAPYWRDRRARNAVLLPAASLLTRAVLERAIGRCDGVLRKLGDGVVDESKSQRASELGVCDSKSLPRRARAAEPRGGKPPEAHRTRRADHAGRSGARGTKKS